MPVVTERLLLRPWEDRDRRPFVAMSSDAETMRYLRPLPTEDACNRWIDHQRDHQAAHGFCLWAVELQPAQIFIGAVGLLHFGFETHFSPAIEVGWRLARGHWGLGYASEAGGAAVAFAFNELRAPEVVAHAAVNNQPSRQVMEKLGMTRNPDDDFDHPKLSADDPLQRQVLYRITAETWLRREG